DRPFGPVLRRLRNLGLHELVPPPDGHGESSARRKTRRNTKCLLRLIASPRLVGRANEHRAAVRAARPGGIVDGYRRQLPDMHPLRVRVPAGHADTHLYLGSSAGTRSTPSSAPLARPRQSASTAATGSSPSPAEGLCRNTDVRSSR